jgi:hypothetical protein
MGEPEDMDEEWDEECEGGSASGSDRSKKSNINFKKFKMKIIGDTDPSEADFLD